MKSYSTIIFWVSVSDNVSLHGDYKWWHPPKGGGGGVRKWSKKWWRWNQSDENLYGEMIAEGGGGAGEIRKGAGGSRGEQGQQSGARGSRAEQRGAEGQRGQGTRGARDQLEGAGVAGRGTRRGEQGGKATQILLAPKSCHKASKFTPLK